MTDYGDADDALDTEAFQAAIDACADAGGGTVAVPSGEYEVGTVRLRSHVTVRLDAGATVFAARDPAAYTDERPGPEGEPPFFLADGVADVALVGRGTFDGRGTEFLEMDEPIRGHSAESRDHPLVSNAPHRARQGEDYLDRSGDTDEWPVAKSDFRPGPMFLFDDCSNVLIRDLTLRDMPAWTVALEGCDGVHVGNVAIDNHMQIPNCDGVSVMNSRDVRVADCSIRSCDDSITVGTTADRDGPTEGVTVTNCTLSSAACAVKFGSETARDIRDCAISNCVVRGSNRGLGIQHRDSGALENVVFSDVTVETGLLPGPWWGKAEPIYVTSIPRDDDADPGPVRNVRFSNVVARSENGALVYAHEDADVRNVRLDGVRVAISRGEHADSVGGNVDLQPTSVVPPIQEREIAALHCENAADVALRDVTVEWDGTPASYYADGLRCVGVDGLVVDGFDGRQAHAADGGSDDAGELSGGERDGDAVPGGGNVVSDDCDAAVRLVETTGATVRNSRARPGTGVFLRAVDTDDDRLFATNDLADADRAVVGDHGFATSGNRPPVR